ncbi:MAG: alternative ribosome rescue aminoacyl-tRNA hydrolase ArfB [Pseudomonadota bacterium]
MPSEPIAITDQLSLDESELELTYIRSPGAGGQNVNKVATGAQLRFSVAKSRNLFEAQKPRIIEAAGGRATKDGDIVITATRFRTQEANRRDAIERLVTLIRKAIAPRKRRLPTRPSAGAKRRRLDSKKQRGDVKRTRGKVVM